MASLEQNVLSIMLPKMSFTIADSRIWDFEKNYGYHKDNNIPSLKLYLLDEYRNESWTFRYRRVFDVSGVKLYSLSYLEKNDQKRHFPIYWHHYLRKVNSLCLHLLYVLLSWRCCLDWINVVYTVFSWNYKFLYHNYTL